MNLEDLRTHHFDNEDAPRLYAGEWRIKAGFCAESHAHPTDHFSILARGRAKVEVDGDEQVYESGAIIVMNADKVHKVTALSDIVWFCIHAIDDHKVPEWINR